MRSAPTLKIWITPVASVAMLEKLALLKIALCRAPVFSSALAWRTSMLASADSAVLLWGGIWSWFHVRLTPALHRNLRHERCGASATAALSLRFDVRPAMAGLHVAALHSRSSGSAVERPDCTPDGPGDRP